MNIQVKSLTGTDTQKTMVEFCYEEKNTPLGLMQKQGKEVFSLAQEEGFNGKIKESAVLHPKDPSLHTRIIVAGLGKKKEISYENIRIAAASAIKRAESLRATSVVILMPNKNDTPLDYGKTASVLAEAVHLRSYRFIKYKTPKDDDVKPLGSVDIIVSEQRYLKQLRDAVVQAVQIADSVCFVRDLVNEQPSAKFPRALADTAKKLSKPGSIQVKIIEKTELEKMGMNGLLGVSRGSHQPPVFIHLVYKPKKTAKKKIIFVGKGITFDSGGLNLKPSAHIETMKLDMAGAATVLGIFKLLPLVSVPYEIHGLIPCAENLPGGGAMKPSDLVKAFNGKTIEVLNTDAEGRLILADALSYGVTLKPDIMIDMATLTGAVQAAVGNLITGIMGTSQKTMDQINAASKECGEDFLQFPLFQAYDAQMKSMVADLKNIGASKGGGAIIGGLFLKNFIDTVPWVHLDIAGTAWTSEDLAYCPPGGTGVPLRSLIQWLLALR